MERMGETSVDEGVRKVSAWPVFVATGLALSEVGVVLGIGPIAVGGLLLFGGSVVGIVQEAGYVEEPWPLLAAFGVVLALSGAGLLVLGDAILVRRGWAIAGAGILLVGAAIVGTIAQQSLP